MKIFIRNVPGSTTQNALKKFAEQLILPRWYTPFTVKGRVVSCMVQKVKDRDGEQIEFQGLLDIQPFKAAQLAIERLNGQELNGRRIEARKWHTRSQRADRRDLFRKSSSNAASERRAADRRRPNLVKETHVPLRFEGVKGFNRRYDE